MFGVYIQVHIKCFLTFLEAHSLHIFLEIFYQLWPAQASSELGLIYQLWLAQKQPSSLQLLNQAVSITTYYVPFSVILILFRYLHTL